jgi:hypothetical protein
MRCKSGDRRRRAPRRLLNPRVRAELERAPEGEEWSLGSGWIICSFQGTLDVENADRFLAHARTILGK